ncbi:MAG: DDE-type integrase/transposase/recombinase [Oscillospiraceae bacterium]
MTCFKIKDDYLYICVILDLFSRKVVAHRISQKNSTQLITGTFKQAFEKRDCPAGLIFHSDRGTQLYIQHFSKTIAFESGNAVVLQPRKAD